MQNRAFSQPKTQKLTQSAPKTKISRHKRPQHPIRATKLIFNGKEPLDFPFP